MDWKERAKKVGRTLLYGAIWVYVLSIPVGDRLLFDHAYDLMVDNSVVHTIQREFTAAVKQAKHKARAALADGESDLPREAKNAKAEF